MGEFTKKSKLQALHINSEEGGEKPRGVGDSKTKLF